VLVVVFAPRGLLGLAERRPRKATSDD
jgi:hypothetical protein